MTKCTGNLITITAPSGAGKTSLVKALLAEDRQLALTISHTTRPKRPQERDGIDYHFVDSDLFAKLEKQGAFVETAQVFDHQYGTAKLALETARQGGQDVLLEIDWQGARQVHALFPEAVSIFILPPNQTALAERLRSRNQDNPDIIQKRLKAAHHEIAQHSHFDYLVVNDDFALAKQELQAIITSARLTYAQQTKRQAKRLAEWSKTAYNGPDSVNF